MCVQRGAVGCQEKGRKKEEEEGVFLLRYGSIKGGRRGRQVMLASYGKKAAARQI